MRKYAEFREVLNLGDDVTYYCPERRHQFKGRVKRVQEIPATKTLLAYQRAYIIIEPNEHKLHSIECATRFLRKS